MTDAQKNDFLVGFVLFGLALFGLFWVIPEGVMSPGQVEYDALAPRFWPNIVMTGLAFAGVWIMGQGLVNSRRHRTPILRCPKKPGSDSETDQGYKAALNVLVCMLGLFVYYASLEYVGFILASSLAVLFFTWLGGERRFLLQLAIAVVLPLALYYFFVYAANVPLPLGVFESWRG